MDDPNENPRYQYRVEWTIFDSVGNQLEKSSKPFVKRQSAQNFAEKLKRETPRNRNAIVNIRELELDVVIESFKKKTGNVNFKRGRK